MGDEILDSLNPEQRSAVTADDRAVLVLAGAGSGKTRVIAHRVAYLLEGRHLSPQSLLSLTFTNKAASEMRERILKLLNKTALPFLWMGTFHSICARVLREDIEAMKGPFTRDFTIFDADDALGLVKHILKERGISDKNFQPRTVLGTISRAKGEGVEPAAFAEKAKTFGAMTIAPVYEDYARRLEESNALDFDDLLLLAARLLQAEKRVAEKYRHRFAHILVDEYQDTNKTQYSLLKMIAGPETSIFAVGDEDQSIYKWRGADISNILDFQRDFPGAKVIRLEQNYRSTTPILSAANSLVTKNKRRLGKNLWTDRRGGAAVTLFEASSDREEASFVADSLKGLHSSVPYRCMAVLYRTNAQSRTFEEALLNRTIEYQVVGGLKFYERKEVKDILAYLRLATNELDRVSFLRVVNVPPRGIGKATVDAVAALSQERRTSLWGAAKVACEESNLPSRALVALRGFIDTVGAIRAKAETVKPSELAEFVIARTRYFEYLASASDPAHDTESRADNVRELVSAMGEFEKKEGGGLRAFLERQALASDQDSLDTSERDTVKLMTLHSAKGLEFPVVFLVGMERDLLPHTFSTGTPEDIEEERRLCYVGMTRAMDRLTLTWARSRFVFGYLQDRAPSPFLQEIGAGLLEEVGGGRQPAWIPGELRPGPIFVEPEAAPPRFRIGSRVQHDKFGFGIVLATEGEGEDVELMVSFNKAGKKKLLASMAKLKVV